MIKDLHNKCSMNLFGKLKKVLFKKQFYQARQRLKEVLNSDTKDAFAFMMQL